MIIRLLSIALEDLDSGRQFYERVQDGLGDYFLDSLFSDIDALQIHAGIHPKVHGYHRSLADRFPFAIYYRVVREDVEVWRVLDCRQRPSKTLRALTDP